MYYYKIKGEKRIRSIADKFVKGDPHQAFDPQYYDRWSHKNDEDGAIDDFWVSETEHKNDLLLDD